MKSKNRVRSLLLTDQLWDDLNVIAAKSRKTRAEIIREALAAACVPKNLPTSVFRPAGPDMSGLHRDPPRTTPVPVRPAPPKPAPEPEYEDVDAIFERERSEVNPDELFGHALARGESREEARKQVKAFMSAYDLPEDEWEPLDATVCNEIVSANGSNAVRYADDTEEEAREPDADARDARPH